MLQIGGEKGNILIWSMESNCLLYDIEAHVGSVYDCSWSGDSRCGTSVKTEAWAREQRELLLMAEEQRKVWKRVWRCGQTCGRRQGERQRVQLMATAGLAGQRPERDSCGEAARACAGSDVRAARPSLQLEN